MGLVSGLKGLLGKHSRDTKNEVPSSELVPEKEQCLITHKLRRKQYELFAMYYYRGATSYRIFFTKVFMRNMKHITPITNAAEKRANKGCDIDATFVRFYMDKVNYIDIPFDDFSEKKNMRINRRKAKLWHKTNVLRILKKYPKYRELDDKQLKEATIALIIEEIFN